MVPQAMKYIACDVLAQWIALVANIAIMVTIGLFIEQLMGGNASGQWLLTLGCAGAAAIVVRMVCLSAALL